VTTTATTMTMTMPKRRRATGFSLVEVLVVIGIIAILLALLMPKLSRVHESERSVQCAAQLRQLGQAFHN
jgi:prepilin-type N-terminal cleavage/methylation domain-containing protein